jgi:hypothetical protein
MSSRRLFFYADSGFAFLGLISGGLTRADQFFDCKKGGGAPEKNATIRQEYINQLSKEG